MAASQESQKVTLLKHKAVQGDAAAQNRLGLCYEYGKGVEKDHKKAVELYQQAASQGNAAAQNNLGLCYENGKVAGVAAKNRKKAAELYQQAASQGYAEAQNNLGRCYENGKGVEKDLKKAAELYQQAASQGNAAAQNNLGWCHENGIGVAKDLKKAVELYQQAAKQGDAAAQNNLGRCYENGNGVAKDLRKAAELYQQAVSQGNAAAQNHLGRCYENGNGVAKDLRKAAELYQQAARQGHAEARFRLGRCYENGEGMPKDLKKAAELYQQAANQGHAEAQSSLVRLGLCYENGNGVAKDLRKAVELYQQAAEQRNVAAQNHLGRCYENGIGVAEDLARAEELYQQAAKQGDAEAQVSLVRCKDKAKVKAELVRSAVREAEERGFTCPLSRQIMADPVVASDGFTYEREQIQTVLNSTNSSPMTREVLTDIPDTLRTNRSKKGEISEFLQKHPDLYDGDEVYLPKSWKEELVAAITEKDVKKVQEWLTKDRRLLTVKLEGEYTAFHLACEFGSPELANFLLENLIKRNVLDKIPNPPPEEFEPNHLNALVEKAVLETNQARFSLLVELGAKIYQTREKGTWNTLLHKLAIQGGPLEPIQWLLDNGLYLEDQNEEGNTALLLAVSNDHVAFTQRLLKLGAEVNTQNNQKESPVAIALLKRNKQILELLVGPEKAALPPLHLAVELGDISLIKTLIKQEAGQASLETRDAEGRMPFYVLLTKEYKEVREKQELLRLFLGAGANPIAACGTKELTPLHIAAEQGDIPTLKLLLQKLRLKAPAAIDTENSEGETALHMAARMGQDEAISCLLEAGADFETRTHAGRTPMELAREQNKPKTAAFISQKVREWRAQSEEITRLREELQEQNTLLRRQSCRIAELEKEVAQLSQKPSLGEADAKERGEQRSSSLRVAPSRASSSFTPLYQQKSKPGPKASAEAIQTFLNHVASGRQDKAEAILKENPNLALASGTVTDYPAKRTFKDITGFQYAVWALDWQMWKMIRKYLLKEEAQEQAKGFSRGAWVVEHGEHANWQKLIDAYQTLIDNWDSWDQEQINEHWVKQIGGGQLLLPAHLLQEYNQPDRPFYPCPNFSADYILSRVEPEWWTSSISGLGKVHAWGRFATGQSVTGHTEVWYPDFARRGWRRVVSQVDLQSDQAALAECLVTRTQQQTELVAELSTAQRLSLPSPAK